jgi:hypothetical protein
MPENISVVSLLSKEFTELLIIPFSKSLQSEFLLEHGINIEEGKVIVLKLNYGFFGLDSVENSSDFSASLFKFMNMLNNIREGGKDEFVLSLPTIDDLSEHSYNHISRDDFSS